MEIKTKFEIGDEVRVKRTEKVGTIKSIQADVFTLHGTKQLVIKYCLQVGAIHYKDWYAEETLEDFIEDTSGEDFNNEFEVGLLELLIDVYLLNPRNLPIIKQLHNQKQSYI